MNPHRLTPVRPGSWIAPSFRRYVGEGQPANIVLGWLHRDHWLRPDASLDCKPPISRLPLNNVAGLQT